MFKIKSIVSMAFAVAIISGNGYAQDCGSCNGTCNNESFGYPSVAGACGGHHEKLDQIRAENARITARNDAWPKPFRCADRQHYHEIWAPMIDQGFEEQCLLSAEHFDAETNELNRFGISAVAGIMQNMPSHRKMVFIHRDTNEDVSEARRASVDSIVQTMYGEIAPNAQVSFSTKLPASVSGVRAETISRQFIESSPTPLIPVAAGTQSVQGSVSQ